MRVLSIGNSFSHDSHKWLSSLAKFNGIDLKTVNLDIGGCSLETHWKNVIENNKYYNLQIDGNNVEAKISISEALKLEEWDVITVQQVSHFSGMYETYEPYLSSLNKTIRKVCPNAKLYFHQTWAYEIDSSHSGFANYGNDQREMYNRIIETSQKAAKSINAELIPTGTVIQLLRDSVSEFDYKNGGLSLCRDAFHLSLDYGRYAAACVWLRTLTGKKLKTMELENADKKLLNKITQTVNKAVR